MRTRYLAIVILFVLNGCLEGEQGVGAGYPPDISVAVGAGYIVETTNARTRIWQNGTVVADPFTSSIFTAGGGCADYRGDPRVLFDAVTGRWFMVAIGRGRSASLPGTWCLAVSQSSNPLGSFYRWEFFTAAVNSFPDQPNIDVSQNKVVLTGVIDTRSYDPQPEWGTQIYVVNKADLLAGRPASYNGFIPGSEHFIGIPAKTLTANDIVYLVGDVESTPANSARIRAIKGVPGESQVTSTNVDVVLSASTVSTMPGPLRDSIDEIAIPGGRTWQDAVRFNDSLWGAQMVTCRPAGDTADRACIRIYEFTGLTPTDPFTPRERQRLAIRSPGDYYHCPAITVDSGGNLVVVTNKTSEVEYPSIYMTGRRTSDTVGTLRALVKAHAGTTPYTDGDAEFDSLRWGDYSGAATLSGTTYVYTGAQ